MLHINAYPKYDAKNGNGVETGRMTMELMQTRKVNRFFFLIYIPLCILYFVYA